MLPIYKETNKQNKTTKHQLILGSVDLQHTNYICSHFLTGLSSNSFNMA